MEGARIKEDPINQSVKWLELQKEQYQEGGDHHGQVVQKEQGWSSK